jgi:subtilisin-like proprotein convertase family protein
MDHSIAIARGVGRLALIVGLLASSAAWSATISSTPASPIAIEDGTANPIFDSIDTSVLFGAGGTVTFVSIDLMLNHTWVGDLEIVLRSPGGVELTLMARPGNSRPEGDFGSPPGDNADFVAANPITFSDAATTSAEDMGSVNVTAGVVQTSSYFPDPTDWDTDIASFAEFVGDPAAGAWQIQIRDYNANGNTGELVGWTLHILAIPEPSTGLMFGFGLVALAGARRRSDRH